MAQTPIERLRKLIELIALNVVSEPSLRQQEKCKTEVLTLLIELEQREKELVGLVKEWRESLLDASKRHRALIKTKQFLAKEDK